MEWLKRFSKAIDYIEDHLTDEISYEAAAEIACCSKNYFQRMFTYVTGLTLSEYIRQRRMTLAAFDLQDCSLKIQDIGAKYGYISPASFHRAFQSVHGVSPSAARSSGVELNSYPAIHFSITVSGTGGLKYRIEERAAMRLVGTSISLPNDIAQYEAHYGAFWKACAKNGSLQEILALNTKSGASICGLVCENTPKKPMYYLAVETDKAKPDQLQELVLPASKWAVFTYFGKQLLTYEEANKRFFTEWLPFTDYEVAQIAEMKVYPAAEVAKHANEFCSKCEFRIAIK